MNIDYYLLFEDKCLKICAIRGNFPSETNVYFDQGSPVITSSIEQLFQNVSSVYLQDGDNVRDCYIVSDNPQFSNMFVSIAQVVFQPDRIFNLNKGNFSLAEIGAEKIKEHLIGYEKELNIYHKLGALAGVTIHRNEPHVIGSVFIEFTDYINVMFLGVNGLFCTFFRSPSNLRLILKQIETTAKAIVVDVNNKLGSRSSEVSLKVPVLLSAANTKQLAQVTQGLKNCAFTLAPRRVSSAICHGIAFANENGLLNNAVVYQAGSNPYPSAQNSQLNASLAPSPSPSPSPSSDMVAVEADVEFVQRDQNAANTLTSFREDNSE